MVAVREKRVADLLERVRLDLHTERAERGLELRRVLPCHTVARTVAADDGSDPAHHVARRDVAVVRRDDAPTASRREGETAAEAESEEPHAIGRQARSLAEPR